jgi:hypothetical protein
MPNVGLDLEDYWRELQGEAPREFFEDGTQKPFGIVGDGDPDLEGFTEALKEAAKEPGAFHINLFEKLPQYGPTPDFVTNFRGDKTLAGPPAPPKTFKSKVLDAFVSATALFTGESNNQSELAEVIEVLSRFGR